MIREIFEILLFISSFFTSLWILLQAFYYKVSNQNIIQFSTKNDKNSNKRIDIIVAIKDEDEKTIKELINNLSGLDYRFYKVIIVSDDTEETFKKIIESLDKLPDNFVIIRRPENKGRKAGALNFATNISDAEMLVYLDAEARVEKDFLRKISQLDYDAVAFRLKVRDVNTQVQKIYSYTNEFVMNALFKARDKLGLIIFANGSAFGIKRDILRKIGGWKENSVAEDLELGIRLALSNIKVKYVDDITVYTLAPYTHTDLYNQIKRWAYGSGELISYSMRLFKLGIRGIEGFIYSQQWGIYPLYLLLFLIIISIQFILNINYFYVFTSLIPILVSNGIYIALIKPKGDYKSGIVTLIASLIGYIQGIFKVRFKWKVTPKSLVGKEEEILSIKILGIILAIMAYINSLFNNTISSLLIILFSLILLTL
ncbi:glycosyltransferase family 2 protein [Saccharolobus solfataricus]|uniref:Glycosyl transferase family 2 n=3 Tax=Saccharolobus solfataricus TaxID=2287 RepID=A0A0E3GUC5_SACSO|nr:glycosyltransferase family 2 protein [Saccharolobus solfataricus]AAK42537.1 Glucosaminyltransferase, intercellular adhesion protein A homolog, putative (icaA) [Saccharolobus solfataricus P2]AKA72632.1 glycosyltransferase family 2 protein [Saccharolobus solfataricus]AKA75331.1 glycosyltransferase family 2 protein [Saccharolobus solfataricus]AKA78024.1 glycosyltransferase family 2 protein [Saccharolobus solfataricus]AZF67143.1 glycosyltransferase family 2 protein [Saccharolobus solfataricus]